MASSKTNSFRPVDSSLFFSKGDARDPRLGEFARSASAGSASDIAAAIQSVSGSGRTFALAGYPDDEGIRASGGRPGAAEAPTRVRHHLYRMTPSPLASSASPVILDFGDLTPAGLDLKDRHECARETARTAMRAGATWLAVGGGHDYGFADASAFADVCSDTSSVRPLVLNFDAHLDVRPYRDARGEMKITSGTPFSRWLDAFPNSDLVEIGLQGQCNSTAHLAWAQERGVRCLFIEDLEASGRPLVDGVLDIMGEWAERRRPAFISVDIDAFSSAYAPGCSQSFATGISPSDFFPTLQMLLKRLDVRALAIYETSPALDLDDRTSKLAAQILQRTLYAL